MVSWNTNFIAANIDKVATEAIERELQPGGIIEQEVVNIVVDMGESGGTNRLIKEMQCFAPIRVGKTVSKRSDGKIVEADSDGAGTQQPVGIALSTFSSANAKGNVLLFAANAEGVLEGLGFAPGDEIFVGENTGGYVNDIAPFTGDNDSIIKVGIADCASGDASGVATDLIMVTQVIARPE